MKRHKIILELVAAELVALHRAALDLEQGLHELSDRTAPYDLREITDLVGHINAVGFAPIEAMLREHRIEMPADESAPAKMQELLAETRVRGTGAVQARIGISNALSVVRRAARYMELSCSSTAETAVHLQLTELAAFLRAWARGWIGLEVTLNAAASTYLPATAGTRSRFSVPDILRSLAPSANFAAA